MKKQMKKETKKDLYFFYTKNRNKNVYLSLYNIYGTDIVGETSKFEDTILYTINDLERVVFKFNELGIEHDYMSCGKSINRCPSGFSLNYDLLLQ